MDNKSRTNENRLRRVAARRGLRLVKSRRRDERAVDYGMFMLIDSQHGGAVNPDESAGRGWASLETIEQTLETK